AIKIAARRAKLVDSYNRVRSAQELCDQARQVADRALRQVKDARLQLASANAADRRYAEEVADAIKAGEAPPPRNNGLDREALRHSVQAAEQAQSRFDSELATAQAALTEAVSN